jgi:hypothetical protein
MDGSTTMEEAILQLRGGEGIIDIAAIIGFIIFGNWLDSLAGVESFQVNPLPHMDSTRFLSVINFKLVRLP